MSAADKSPPSGPNPPSATSRYTRRSRAGSGNPSSHSAWSSAAAVARAGSVRPAGADMSAATVSAFSCTSWLIGVPALDGEDQPAEVASDRLDIQPKLSQRHALHAVAEPVRQAVGAPPWIGCPFLQPRDQRVLAAPHISTLPKQEVVS